MMKQLKPLPANASDDEKIALLVAVIAQIQMDRKENKGLEMFGYAGGGLAVVAPELCARVPELTQIFSSSVDPNQLWYATPILLAFAFGMRGIASYQEKNIEKFEKSIEILQSRQRKSPKTPEV